MGMSTVRNAMIGQSIGVQVVSRRSDRLIAGGDRCTASACRSRGRRPLAWQYHQASTPGWGRSTRRLRGPIGPSGQSGRSPSSGLPHSEGTDSMRVGLLLHMTRFRDRQSKGFLPLGRSISFEVGFLSPIVFLNSQLTWNSSRCRDATPLCSGTLAARR